MRIYCKRKNFPIKEKMRKDAKIKISELFI